MRTVDLTKVNIFRMSRKVIEYEIDSAWETRVESQYTKQHIRVNIKNKHFILLEMDAECGIPNCKGDKCNQNQTTIAKIRKVRKLTYNNQIESYRIKGNI